MGILDSLIGGVASLAGSGIQAWSQAETNKQNEALMRESWAREDNAVQRRAADLEKAGLNPVLAAGSAAQAGSPIQLRAPVSENVGNQAVQAAGITTNVARTEADTRLVNAQAESAQVDADIKKKTAHIQEDNVYLANVLLNQDRMIKANKITPAEFDNVLAAWKKAHVAEFGELELAAARAGVSGRQLENQERALAVELAKKDLAWYTPRAIGGILSQGVSTGARLIKPF